MKVEFRKENRRRLAIVTPVYNEGLGVEGFYHAVAATISTIPGQWKLIFVNDGSMDHTLEVIEAICQKDRRVGYLDLSRNFGHQAAITAGLANVQADAVIVMDGDLQDSPEAIGQFVREWEQGADVVYAVRTKRKENLVKAGLFTLFYRIQSQLVDSKVPVDAGAFSLMDEAVLRELNNLTESNRYLPGLRHYCGYRQKGIIVERNKRAYGEPKVTFLKLVQLAMNGVFAFSTRPLKLILIFGTVVSLFSFMIAAIALFYRYVLGVTVLNWEFGFSTIFFFGGVQMMSIGVLGEYIGRIYEEVKSRPNFIVKHRENIE